MSSRKEFAHKNLEFENLGQGVKIFNSYFFTNISLLSTNFEKVSFGDEDVSLKKFSPTSFKEVIFGKWLLFESKTKLVRD